MITAPPPHIARHSKALNNSKFMVIKLDQATNQAVLEISRELGISRECFLQFSLFRQLPSLYKAFIQPPPSFDDYQKS